MVIEIETETDSAVTIANCSTARLGVSSRIHDASRTRVTTCCTDEGLENGIAGLCHALNLRHIAPIGAPAAFLTEL